MSDFINTDLFPKAGAQDGFLDWLKEISKSAGIEDFDPVLLPKKTADGYVNADGTPYEKFDYMQTIPDFATLSGVGDPRFSLGHMISAAMDKFMPQIQLYTEVAQAGGCQIIDEYICDAEGIPIKKAISSCPPYVNTIQEIKPQDVIEFVTQTYNTNIENDISAFVNYIKTNFINRGYTIRLLVFDLFKGMNYVNFLVEAKKQQDTQYLKYYSTDREKISSMLNIPLTLIDPMEKKDELTMKVMQALSTPYIPVYSGVL